MAIVIPDSGHDELVKIEEHPEANTEDGRLLRMFVKRNLHTKPDAKEKALKGWLIREGFYDEQLDEFVERYAAKSEGAILSAADASKRYKEIVESCTDVLKARQIVEHLEKSVQDAAGDVHKLRDALFAAVKDLSTPRRKLGLASGRELTEEDIEKLKERRQARLRDVVFSCLQGIWLSGVGGEVLQAAMEQVSRLINKFEDKADDVREALDGGSWQKLKGLVGEIEGELPEAVARRKEIEIEGRGTKILVTKALEDLGGTASTSEIFRWVEAHPEVMEEHSKIRLNMKERKNKSHQTVVWQNTLRGVLTRMFQKSQRKRADGAYIWMEKGDTDPTEAIAPQAALPAPAEAQALADGEAQPKAEEAPAGKRKAGEALDSAEKPKAKRTAGKAQNKRQPASKKAGDAEDGSAGASGAGNSAGLGSLLAGMADGDGAAEADGAASAE